VDFTNQIMCELSVPRIPEVRNRVFGFYNELGWEVWPDSSEDELVYVKPSAKELATMAYWHTKNREKCAYFVQNNDKVTSRFAKGLRLPQLSSIVEVVFLMSSGDVVEDVWLRGGKLLKSHAHVPLRSYSGTNEFRFSDPFNYSLRVTGDPGYELR
jgi:hypothetical protein